MSADKRVAILLLGGMVFLGIGLFAKTGFTFGPAIENDWDNSSTGPPAPSWLGRSVLAQSASPALSLS
jgi:hypothetical protein